MSQSLSIHNRHPKTLDGPKYFHHLIDWESHKDLCCLDFKADDGSRHDYTYEQLHTHVVSFAHNILQTLDSCSLQSTEQQIIPILLPQSPALYIAILAILEAGAAYCPINLDSPQERIKFVAQDVSAQIIVTTKALRDSVTWDGGPKVLVLKEIPENVEGPTNAKPVSSEVQPGSLAYVMYTSGSTGKPKGVTLPHHAVTQSLLAHDRYIPSFKRFLQFAAPSFDVSQFEIMFPLFRGATLVACHRPRLLEDLAGVMNDMEVDAAELTPTVAGSLLQKRSHVPQLKALLTIGEMLTRPVVDEFGGSDAQESILYGMYGPTEAAIHCTINPLMQAGSKVANIGLGFPTVSTFIVAIEEEETIQSKSNIREATILPKLDVGELALGGPQLASGYLNRPEQNELAFVTIDGEPAYRTGDKARMLEDGSLEMMGRISSGQVKIRGQRVELGEIEEAVYKHPNIKLAVASVIDGVLVVFALEKSVGTITKEVIDTCSKWLPKYMVPNEIVLSQEFPHLPSGKVDKKALEQDYRDQASENVANDRDNQTGTETKISKVLQDDFNIRVQTSDKLAAHGIDSLTAIRVASSLRTLGHAVAPLDVLQAETLTDLAIICEAKSQPYTNGIKEPTASEALKEELLTKLAEHQRSRVEKVYPASPLQDAMLAETERDGTAYWNMIKIDVNDTTLDRARKAVYDLANANPMLRTGFVHCPNEASTFVQVTWKELHPEQLRDAPESGTRKGTGDRSLLDPLTIELQQNGQSIDLVISIHHAIYDGWALELLLDDLQSLLNGESLHSRPSFDRAVEAYITRGNDKQNDMHSTYWKDHLAQFSPQDIPNFNSLTNIRTEAEVLFVETTLSTSEMTSLANNLASSPQAIMQAAFAILLSSYTGSQDVAFGSVFSGRTDAIEGIDEIIGPCLSTLPVRIDLETVPTGLDLIKQLHVINRAHLEHSNMPLRNIIKATSSATGRSPFDCLLVWQQTLHSSDYKRDSVLLVDSRDYLEFPLTIEVTPMAHNIHFKANFNVAKIPQAQVMHILGQLEGITARLVQSADVPLQDCMSTISDDHLSIDNAKPDTTIKSQSIFATIEALAESEPDRIALNFARTIEADRAETSTLSYRELNRNANQLAHHLMESEIEDDTLICICLEKSLALYSSILAIVKTGAGYLPVTPDTPQDRITYILQESKAKVVVTHSSLKDKFTGAEDIVLICVDEIDLSRGSDRNPDLKQNHEASGYCIFTSGSTGKPKGVLVTRGNLLTNLEVLSDLYPHTSTSRLLQSCSQAFDVSVFEIFWTWHVGACLCVATKDVLFRDIEMAIRALCATHLSMTPTVAALFNPANVPKVEFLVTAGEAVTTKVFNMWAGRGLYQGYGPSETTNICTVNPNVQKNDFINNIGKGFSNTSTFVLAATEEFSILPLGSEGEFCFGGAQVGRGYLDKEQSKGKFIEHPEYGKLYRSGDFGRMLPDKSLSFTGRKDDQIKIRGLRIELGEINNTILASQSAIDCITLVADSNAQGAQRLVCFWVPEQKSSFTDFKCLDANDFDVVITDLFNDITSALPSYMVPNNLIPVSALPQTSNYGKIDKKLLLKEYETLDTTYLGKTSQSRVSATAHDWTPMQEKVAKAVSQVAKISQDDIAPEASFFSLGIDSISAISLASVLREDDIAVEISEILRNSTVIRLAGAIDASHKNRPAATTSSSEDDFSFPDGFVDGIVQDFTDHDLKADDILPCTPLQEAMLSASANTAQAAYSNHTLLKLNISEQKLKTAWTLMVERHAILRTCLLSTELADFAFVQVVLKQYTSEIESIQVDDLNTTLESLQSQPLDPFQYMPPLKLTLIASEDDVHLLLSMHHSLYDGYALSILYGEIEQAIRGQELASPVSFRPFLLQMRSTDVQASMNYWSDRLHAFEAVPLSFDKSTKQAPHIQHLNSKTKLSKIESQLSDLDVSLLSLCQTVWSSLLSTLLSTYDVCFGNIVSGRTVSVSGIDRLVAPCFNTIPVRIKNTSKLTFADCLRSLQAQNIDSLPYQMTPLRKIQAQCVNNGTKLFETLLLLQPPVEERDANIWALEDDTGAMDLPLVIELTPRPSEDDIAVMLHCAEGTLSESEGSRILKLFDETLSQVMNNPRHQLVNFENKKDIEMNVQKRQTSKLEQQRTETTETESMNETETMIRDVFAQFSTTPLEKMQLDITIYRLGLDSINAVQIAGSLRKQGHNVKAADVMENPTIRQLAEQCSKTNVSKEVPSIKFDFKSFDERHRSDACQRLGIESRHVEAIRPCTSVQSGMLAQTLHSHGRDYVNSLVMELESTVRLDDLKAAWLYVSQHLEMLRTRFVQVDDEHYRFAMITFTAESASDLPWYEHKDLSSTSQDLIDFSRSIEGQPWRLDVKTRDTISIRFTAHHALYDAQSLQLILSKVAARLKSDESALPEAQSIEPLIGAILASAKDTDVSKKRQAFWAQQNKVYVNKFPDLTPLLIESQKSFVVSRQSILSIEHVESLCQNQEVSVQAAAQASWARMLAFYTGEPVTTFGLTLSGRSIVDDADAMAFPSIVTVPASISVTGTNRQLLQTSMTFSTRVQKHQFTPLTTIQKLANHPEGRLFDTLFAFQKLSSSEIDNETPWKIVDEKASVDYAISIEFEPQMDGSIQLRMTAKENLIPQEQANLMLQQLDAVFQDILEEPDKLCTSTNLPGTHELLSRTPAEHDVLPSDVNNLHEFVERQVQTTPDKIALEFVTELEPFESSTWTYSELNGEGNRVAHLIQALQIEQGSIVAICFDKCPEASFAMLGILKAGCGYVALDPNAPIDRVKFILEDSKSSLVFSAGKAFERLADGNLSDGIHLADLGNEDTLKKYDDSAVSLSRSIDPRDTSYCLYTSGTTGTPKGCLLTHENAVQVMLAFQRLYAGTWDDDSRWLTVASWHFDVSVMEQYWSWSVGMRLICAPRDLIFEDIPGTINKLKITHIDLTPSLARLVRPEDVPSLWNGVFLTGGEQLKQEILDVWGEKRCIYNAYGPTEATIGCTMYRRVPENGKPANIGLAFPNVGTIVVKPETQEPVFRGGVGELCVSGKLVARGYLNRDELTAKSFPHFHEFENRVYRTGDLVRILHDNTFLFLGRADDQVKLRGQRIQLSEGNEVMKKNVDGIDEVVTLVLKHAKQQKEQLVTFFVPKKAESSNESLIRSMRDACKAHLPPYMVPTHIIPLKSIPLSANSKADSKQLAQTYNEFSVEQLQKLGADSQSTREWSQKDRKVLQALAQALGTQEEDLTPGTTIFELGVDSISVIGLSRSLQAAGYKNAQLSVIMKNPALDKLLDAITSKSNADTAQRSSLVSATQRMTAFAHKHKTNIADELGIDASHIEAIAPCTPAQEGMIYRFLDSDENLYLNKFEFKLNKDIDVQRVKMAWKKVMQHVQTLRTAFVLTSDGCAQVVLDQEEIGEEFYEHNEKKDKMEIIRSPWIVEFIDSKAGEDVQVMILTMFHALYDGMSLPLLLGKVHDEYLETKDIQYGPDFQSVLPYGPLADLEGSEEFWKDALDGMPFTSMKEVKQPAKENAHAVRIVKDTQQLEKLRQTLGLTYQAVLQAAWSSVLQELLSPLVSFGLVLSGRSIDFENTDQIVGPLLNTVVFQTSIESGMSWKDLIEACHRFNTAMLPYQHTALKDIQKWCGNGPAQTLFDTLFVFQRGAEDSKGDLWTIVDSDPVADYPLAFEAQLNADDSLSLTIVGQPEFVTQDMAESLLQKVENALSMLQKSEDLVPVSDTKRIRRRSSRRDSRLSDGRAAGQTNFSWSKEALTIKKQVETLSESEDVSENISLFELGLDSIDVIKLSSRLKKLGINLSVSAIIRGQTIAGISKHIAASQPVEEKPIVSIEEYGQKLRTYLTEKDQLPNHAASVLPATPLQEGMVAEMIASDYSRYLNHEVYRLLDGTDFDRLKSAWLQVVKDNDILRTSFVEVDAPDMPMSYAQIIVDTVPEFETITTNNAGNIQSLIDQQIARAIEDARQGQLFGLRKLEVANETYFMLSISHALYDGFSLQALHNDVWKIYQGQQISRPSPHKILERILSQDGPDAKKFWKTTLEGLADAHLPLKSQASSEVHRHEKQSARPLKEISAFCRRNAISLQTLAQTCWALLLASYQESLDVAFGEVLSCRESDEANELMFPLMNTVAIRSVIHGSLVEMLRYMQENSNEMRQFEHFPLRKAQALAGPRGGGLFDTLFIYQGRAGAANEEHQALYEARSSVSEVEFPICIEIEIINDELVWRTACKDVAMSETETKALIDSLDGVLNTIMNNPHEQTIKSVKGGLSICDLPAFVDKTAPPPTTDNSRASSVGARDTPWTDTEKTIRNVLAQVSQVDEEEIDRDQTIFHLGLDSISAIKVSSLLKRQGVKLKVQAIMQNNTIRKMAAHMREMNGDSEMSRDDDAILKRIVDQFDVQDLLSKAGLKESDIEDFLPVSAGQRYMLSRWQVSGGTAFTANFEYRINGTGKDNFDKAWNTLVDKHSVLRTMFIETSSSVLPFVQAVLKNKASPIRWDADSDRYVTGAATHETDITLSETSFLAATVKDNITILNIHLHHALYDAISLPLLMQDLESLLRGTSSTKKPASLKKFIAGGLDADENSYTSRRTFWQTYLGKSDTNVTESTSNQRSETFRPSVEVGSIAKTAQSKGFSVDTMLLAAFSQCYTSFLARKSQPRQQVIGLYLSNRAEYPGLIAPTLNLLPLRIEEGSLDDVANSFQDAIRRISDPLTMNTSLAEIYEWTGVQVNCFVNIWKSVSVDEEQTAPSSPVNETPAPSDDFSIENSNHEAIMRSERADIVTIKPDEKIASKADDVMKKAYLPSIDCELKLWGDGNLDVGIFAPLDLMTIEEAKEFSEEFCVLLRSL